MKDYRNNMARVEAKTHDVLAIILDMESRLNVAVEKAKQSQSNMRLSLGSLLMRKDIAGVSQAGWDDHKSFVGLDIASYVKNH